MVPIICCFFVYLKITTALNVYVLRIEIQMIISRLLIARKYYKLIIRMLCLLETILLDFKHHCQVISKEKCFKINEQQNKNR